MTQNSCFLIPVTLCLAGLLGCTDDSSSDSRAARQHNAAAPYEPEPTSDSPARPEAEPEPTAEPMHRDGPEGCYLEESHACDCELDENECEDVGVWTTGCNSCGAAAEDAGNAVARVDAGTRDAGATTSRFGCYDPAVHMCECDATEAACLESGGIWTDECTGCSGPGPDTDAGSAVDADPDAGHLMDAGASSQIYDAAASADSGARALDGSMIDDAGWDDPSGCYDPATHACDCLADEASCTASDGIWTDQCGCPG